MDPCKIHISLCLIAMQADEIPTPAQSPVEANVSADAHKPTAILVLGVNPETTVAIPNSPKTSKISLDVPTVVGFIPVGFVTP